MTAAPRSDAVLTWCAMDSLCHGAYELIDAYGMLRSPGAAYAVHFHWRDAWSLTLTPLFHTAGESQDWEGEEIPEGLPELPTIMLGFEDGHFTPDPEASAELAAMLPGWVDAFTRRILTARGCREYVSRWAS